MPGKGGADAGCGRRETTPQGKETRMPAPSPAPARPSPAVHRRLEQLRDAEGHGAHEVVSGGPVPVPHLHAKPALHVPGLQIAAGREGRSEGPARGSPTSAPSMLQEPISLLSWGLFPALRMVFPPRVLPKRVPLPTWARSRPRALSQSPSWSFTSVPLGFSLRISPLFSLQNRPSVFLSAGFSFSSCRPPITPRPVPSVSLLALCFFL